MRPWSGGLFSCRAMTIQCNFSVQRLDRVGLDWQVGRLTALAAGDTTSDELDFLPVGSSLAASSFLDTADGGGERLFTWTVNDPVSLSVSAS